MNMKPYSFSIAPLIRVAARMFKPSLACLLFLTIIFPLHSSAQVVNGYAEVTNVSGTTLTVSSVDEAGDTFEDGDYVVIIQMQDDVIGNVSNTASFGDLGSIGSAGLYEVKQITSHTESGGLPTSITFSGALTNTYATGANSHVQVVTFPTFGSPDYTTTSNMSAADWDGTTGGILAFQVLGTLTLAHSLDASGAGFRGGARDISNSGACDVTTFFSTNTNDFAGKGEGIYRNTNPAYDEAKGKILNGGGGGNEHNGGGGGGGGYAAGGDGGPGWNCGGNSAGGLGGIALGTYISTGRVFLGGGGGGGEGNNSVSTVGADGGGIILISANEIRTSGACGGLSISADGNSSANAGNDGAGGAGAGGCIVIDVISWNIDAGCPITVSSSGGDAGRVGSGGVHGGGGGGGQGAVIYSITPPTSNTTTLTNNGSGGCNTNSSPCNSQAPDGGNGVTSGVGIIGNMSGPLPIELISFEALRIDRSVHLSWSTASETNNDFFLIERSEDGAEFRPLLKSSGAGNSTNRLDYYDIDFEPLDGTAYYRLKQVDFDGKFSYSPVAVVNGDQMAESLLYPNPSKAGLEVVFVNQKLQGKSIQLKVVSVSGKTVVQSIAVANDQGRVSVLQAHEALPAGMYIVVIESSGFFETKRLMIQ